MSHAHRPNISPDLHTKDASVTVTLTLEKVVALMHQGVLCGADLHASDAKTQALVHQACLQSCQKKVCEQCEHAQHCPAQHITWPLPKKMPFN